MAVSKIHADSLLKSGQATSTTGILSVSKVYKHWSIVIAHLIYKHTSGSSVSIALPYTSLDTVYSICSDTLRSTSMTLALTDNDNTISLVSGSPVSGTSYIVDFIYATLD